MWSLWINTLKSRLLPVFGSEVCGWWHMMQRAVPTREPPWNDMMSWHLLQSASRTTSRGAGLEAPDGTKSKVVDA